jgi:hypothetical protein
MNKQKESKIPTKIKTAILICDNLVSECNKTLNCLFPID